MSSRLTVVYTDMSTGHEIACFWNPRINVRMCFLRYEKGHERYPLFIRFLRRFWVCVSCKGSSMKPGYTRTQNIIVESQACDRIEYDDYKTWRTDDEQYKEMRRIESELTFTCFTCIDNFNPGIDRDVVGVEFFTVEEESYCCIYRGTIEELLRRDWYKCTCYTGKEDKKFMEFTGKLVRCD